MFEEQLKKYEQVKVYIDQNLAAQENILKALTEANVQYASVRKSLSQTEQQWNSTVQGLVGSYEAYEDLIKKSQEGKEFYDDLEAKASRLLERAKNLCQTRAGERKPILEKYVLRNETYLQYVFIITCDNEGYQINKSLRLKNFHFLPKDAVPFLQLCPKKIPVPS